MALFGLVDTSAVEEFAGNLAADLTRRFPPSSEGRTDAGAERQLKIILEGLGARAVRFKGEKGLGVFKKAKLGTVFKYKLKEAGYTDAFVNRATDEIIKRISVN
jgi:hypothetical protein